MSDNVPAWVLRMEKATDVGWRDDIPTGYSCSGFEANAIAREWREQQEEIELLRGEVTQLKAELAALRSEP